MERYIIFIPADGPCRLVPCDNGDICKLSTLQQLVGGFIEVTESSLDPTWAREPVECIHLIVNEEGLLHQLPDNPRASSLYILGDRSAIPSWYAGLSATNGSLKWRTAHGTTDKPTLQWHQDRLLEPVQERRSCAAPWPV